MEKIYFNISNLGTSGCSFVFEPESYYVGATAYPLLIELNNNQYDYDSKLFSYYPDTTEIAFDSITGRVNRFFVLQSAHVKIHNEDFDVSRYLQLKMVLGISVCSKNEKEHIRYISMGYVPRYHVYNNIILAMVSDKTPRYMLYEGANTSQIGILVDKDFTITGFVFWVTNPKIRTVFLDNIWPDGLNTLNTLIESPQFLFDRRTIMENKESLIKKILELKNVPIESLLYYGVNKGLIDDQFLIDYACESLLYNELPHHELRVELAGLLQHEIAKARILLRGIIADADRIMYQQGQYFNKIWFYLSLAADMHAEKIIE